MSTLDTYLALLDMDFFELGEAFKGLQDEHVWQRPAEGLLSIGEIAGHIAFWEATRLAGDAGDPIPDPANCAIKSPLIDRHYSYYTHTQPSAPAQEDLTAEQVYAELQRVHKESVEYLKGLNADLGQPLRNWPKFWTMEETLKYQIFHIAYHAGQIYSARHLLGEETPDN